MKKLITILLLCLLLFAMQSAAFADDVFFCRMCGRQIPADSRFCCYCGESVVAPKEAAPVEVALPPAAAASEYERPAAAPQATQTPLQAQPIADVKTASAVPGPFNTSGTSLAVPGKVSVTKSPTSESVPYGGAAVFIAHAVNSTGITWYLADASAGTIYNAYEAPQYISGLTVYGQGTDTLTLCGIPSWMNGWQVQAGFNGEGGPVYTAIAYIWTYQQTVWVDPVYNCGSCCEYCGCYPCCAECPYYGCGLYDYGAYYPYYPYDYYPYDYYPYDPYSPAYTPVSYGPSAPGGWPELPPPAADWGWGLPSAPVTGGMPPTP